MSRLSGLYYTQGRYAEAEPLYKRALTIREKALGSGHPDVAESLNNLAELYRAQGRYADAERTTRSAFPLRFFFTTPIILGIISPLFSIRIVSPR